MRAACAATENAPVITACDAITVAAVANITIGHSAQLGDQQKEGRAHGGRIADQQRPLAEIVERQRGQHQEEPGPGDRLPAEVTHIGIKRLRAGDGEHDRGQREEGDLEMPDDECQCVRRGECLEDLRMRDDAGDSACADRDEPRDHHRAERTPDDGGAVPLDVEEHDDDADRDRHDPLLEIRVDDLDALDRGKHGDRRGDHAVAEEQ